MYPPKVHQFAYVTDEACTEDEILSMEIIVMKVKDTRMLLVNPWPTNMNFYFTKYKRWSSNLTETKSLVVDIFLLLSFITWFEKCVSVQKVVWHANNYNISPHLKNFKLSVVLLLFVMVLIL